MPPLWKPSSSQAPGLSWHREPGTGAGHSGSIHAARASECCQRRAAATHQGWHCPLASLCATATAKAWPGGCRDPSSLCYHPPREGQASSEGSWQAGDTLDPSRGARPGTGGLRSSSRDRQSSLGLPKTTPGKLCQAPCGAQSCCPCLFVLPVGAAEPGKRHAPEKSIFH